MSETTRAGVGLPTASDSLPVAYDRPPSHAGMIAEKDVMVPMRDGVNLCVDIYRPDTKEKLPVLLAFSIYNKDLQGPEVAASLPPQPSWSSLWAGLLEAGDTKYLVSRGYVHVIGSPRGVGKSDGGGSRQWDSYDLIEWIAQQPWCDGNVGMVGISGFGAEQFHAAKQKPPHLKAIFPFDPRGAFGVLGSFREEYPGGVLHFFRYLIMHFAAMHQNKGKPGTLPPEREALWQAAMNNPDYRMYPHVFNVLTQKGQHMPPYFGLLIDPYDNPALVEEAEKGDRWHRHPGLYRRRLVRLHLQDPSQRRAKLFPAPQGAEEARLPRPRASGTAVPFVPRRDPALARSLAQRHRHRRHERAAGALLADGRQRMAHRQRLAAAGNAMDQVLSQELGAFAGRGGGAVERRRRSSRRTPSCRCRRPRPTRYSRCAT